MSDSESDVTVDSNDFGSLLSTARISQNYTVDDISEHTKIPLHFIIAIESNDIQALPGDTFARGYLRVYAKFLEISENSILERYQHAVPREAAVGLKPRSNLPGEASSQSPLIKAITIFLLFAGIAAVIYGGFQYYQEKAGLMEGARESQLPDDIGSSLDSPASSRQSGSEDLRFADVDDEPAQSRLEPPAEMPEPEKASAAGEKPSAAGDENELQSAVFSAQQADTAADEPVTENDVLEIFAENGSWVDVRDADGRRLFYNTVPKGETKILQGKAPFRISLGNARTTRVLINDLEIDMRQYIQPKNTVKFTVSTEQQKVIIN